MTSQHEPAQVSTARETALCFWARIAAELSSDALGGSEYLSRMHGIVAGRPAINLEAEVKAQALVRDAIGKGLIKSAHDVSEGGLAVAVAESCVIGSIGATLELDLPGDARIDAALFGEAPAHIVASGTPDFIDALRALCEDNGVSMVEIGTVGGDAVSISGLVDVPLASIADTWEGALLT